MREIKSFTKIKRDTVVSLCRKTIAEIEAKRAEKEKAWIESRRGMTGWFKNRRPQTDAEVVSAAGWDAFLEVPSSYAWGTLDTAKKLLDLATASEDDFISITAEDFQAIK